MKVEGREMKRMMLGRKEKRKRSHEEKGKA